MAVVVATRLFMRSTLCSSKQNAGAVALPDQWTSRATLSFPLDADELLNNVGNILIKTSSHLANSVPSTVTKSSEIVEGCLFAFIDLNLELAAE